MLNDWKHILFRPSMAPGLNACPSYTYRDPNSPRVGRAGNVFAALGSAIHEVFEKFISVQSDADGNPVMPTKDEMLSIATKWNVSLDGYYGMAWRCKRLAEEWKKSQAWKYFTDPKREEEISAVAKNGYKVTGHPDIYQVYADYAVVADLKMGEQEGVDHFSQALWYAWLIHKSSGVPKVYAMIFAPMLEIWETRVFGLSDFEGLESRFELQCKQSGFVYNGPNQQCRWCENATRCPALSRAIDPMVQQLSVIKSGAREIRPSDIMTMRPFFKTMEQWCEVYKQAERALVEQFGEVPLADGTVLAIVEDTREKVKASKAFEYLVHDEHISPEDVWEKLNITKEGIAELAAIVAEPRSRTKGLGVTKKRFLDELRERGAIEETTFTRVSVKRSATQIKEVTK